MQHLLPHGCQPLLHRQLGLQRLKYDGQSIAAVLQLEELLSCLHSLLPSSAAMPSCRNHNHRLPSCSCCTASALLASQSCHTLYSSGNSVCSLFRNSCTTLLCQLHQQGRQQQCRRCCCCAAAAASCSDRTCCCRCARSQTAGRHRAVCSRLGPAAPQLPCRRAV